MAQRGRKPGFRMPQEHRSKIRVTQLLNLLDQDAMGQIELKDGRRRSIEILLRKAMPDLAATQIEANVASYVARLPQPAASADAWSRQIASEKAIEAQGTAIVSSPVVGGTKH